MSPLTGNFGHFVAAFANGDGQSCERSAIQLDCHWVSLFRLIARRRSPFRAIRLVIEGGRHCAVAGAPAP